MIRTALTTLALMGTLVSAQAPPMDRPPQGPMGGAEGTGPRRGPGPEGMGPGQVFKALGLSKDQDKAIQALMEKHRAGSMARRKAAAEAEEAVRAALEDPATSEAALRDLHAKASEARVQDLLEHRSLIQEVNALLTPGQRAKAARIRENQQRERAAHRAVQDDLGGPEGRPGPPPPPR